MSINNLNKLIFINKSGPFDPQATCFKPIDFIITCKVELDLVMELEEKFQNAMEREDFPNLNNSF
jgi:hypothetical protein